MDVGDLNSGIQSEDQNSNKELTLDSSVQETGCVDKSASSTTEGNDNSKQNEGASENLKSESPDVSYAEDFERASTAASMGEECSQKSDTVQATTVEGRSAERPVESRDSDNETKTSVSQEVSNGTDSEITPEQHNANDVTRELSNGDARPEGVKSESNDLPTLSVVHTHTEDVSEEVNGTKDTSNTDVDDTREVGVSAEIMLKNKKDPTPGSGENENISLKCNDSTDRDTSEKTPECANGVSGEIFDKHDDSKDTTEIQVTSDRSVTENSDDFNSCSKPCENIDEDNTKNMTENMSENAEHHTDGSPMVSSESQKKETSPRLTRSNSQVIEAGYREIGEQGQRKRSTTPDSSSVSVVDPNQTQSEGSKKHETLNEMKDEENISDLTQPIKQASPSDLEAPDQTEDVTVNPNDLCHPETASDIKNITASGSELNGGNEIATPTSEGELIQDPTEENVENTETEKRNDAAKDTQVAETKDDSGGTDAENAEDDREKQENDTAETNESRGEDGITPETRTDESPEQTDTPRSDGVTETKSHDSEEKGPVEVNTEDDEQKESNSEATDQTEKASTEESILSKQNAEKEAFQQMIDENAKLRHDCEQMNKHLEKMGDDYKKVESKMSELRTKNEQQSGHVKTLEKDIERLKQSGDGEDKLREAQQRLIRQSKEDERKDDKIRTLERQLSEKKKEIKKLETEKNEIAQEKRVPESKACTIL